MRLKDKVAIVTGVASGIGRGLAQVFACAGRDLALVDINEVGLNDTYANISAVEVIAVPADVSLGDNVQWAINQTRTINSRATQH